MPPAKPLEKLTPQIDALIQKRLASAPVPGLSVGIARGGELAWYGAYGAAELKSGRKPDAQTISRVASITKTFTATAIMQLRDASLLTLDDPVVLHLPEFAVVNARAGALEAVTIRRMLTHYSGLSTEHPDLDWDTPDFPSMRHILDNLDKVEVVIPQDSAWKYSNLAFSLLGEVISRLSGKPYMDYVRSEVIGPLGLQNTVFNLSPAQKKLKAEGYSPPLPGAQGSRIAANEHTNGFASAGQLHSNTEDLAKWIAFQFGEGSNAGKVLAAQTRAEMHRPQYISPDWSSGQCLGWRCARVRERVFINHGGGIHGFASSICFNVPAKTGAIVLANTWPVTWPYELSLELADFVIEQAGPVEASPAKAAATAAAPTAAGDLSQYAGRYFAEPGVYVRVEASGSALRLMQPVPGEYALHAPATLTPSEEQDAFRVVDGRGAGELAVFGRDGGGKVTSFRLGGFLYRRVK
jgi:CubicO group peptidase (beta-lactamase class C family)